VEFTADRNTLAEAVVSTANGIPTNPVEPIYAGMYITANEKSVVYFTGSDRDTSHRASINAQVHQGGLITLPGRLLSEIVRSLPDKEVTFSCPDVTTDPVTITCGRSAFTLRPYREPYPGVGKACDTPATLPAEDFSDAVKAVIPAASKTDATATLHGLLLEPGDSRLTLVATDRYRVAAFELSLEQADAGDPRCVIPTGAVDRFRKGITSDEVYLGWNDDSCTMTSGNFATTTRQIAGDYADWRKFFTGEPPDVLVNVEELTGAVKRAQLTAEGEEPVELSFTQGLVTVSAGSGHTSSETLNSSYYDGGEFRVLFGVSYLLDGLNGCEEENCHFGLTDPRRPVTIQSGRFRYVVLPRRRP
jgi:DNA polymerase III subunit beta